MNVQEITEKIKGECNAYKLEDLEIGVEESFTVQMTKARHDAFRMLSGDINPMHTDEDFAVGGGYSGCIAYGMCTAAFYSTLVGVYLPGKNCLFLECDVKWIAPVYVGDILEVKGKVSDIDLRFGRMTINAHICNQDGKKVSKAKLIVEVQDR